MPMIDVYADSTLFPKESRKALGLDLTKARAPRRGSSPAGDVSSSKHRGLSTLDGRRNDNDGGRRRPAQRSRSDHHPT